MWIYTPHELWSRAFAQLVALLLGMMSILVLGPDSECLFMFCETLGTQQPLVGWDASMSVHLYSYGWRNSRARTRMQYAIQPG